MRRDDELTGVIDISRLAGNNDLRDPGGEDVRLIKLRVNGEGSRLVDVTPFPRSFAGTNGGEPFGNACAWPNFGSITILPEALT